MAKWLTNKEDAIELHSQFYSGKFEVIPIMHLGMFYSWWFLGPSSRLNCWDGYMSSDGEKLVVTKSGYIMQGVIKKQWILKPESIETIRFKRDRFTLFTDKKYSGLTTRTILELFFILQWEALRMMLSFGISLFFIKQRKETRLRLLDDFKNVEPMKKLLMRFNIKQSSQMTENVLTCNNCSFVGKLQLVKP